MALYLILSLGATAGLFFLAGADFVGSMQLLIYVGGTLVLLVFGVMLTAQGPFVSMKTARRRLDRGRLLSGCLLAHRWCRRRSASQLANQPVERTTAAAHGRCGTAHRRSRTSPPWRVRTGAGRYLGADRPRTVGRARRPAGQPRPEALEAGMSGYLLPFEFVSVHLLVVLVGAAYLARTKQRATVGTV